MLTLVLRREHVDRQTSMATAEYRRGHGTHIFRFDKALASNLQLLASFPQSLAQRISLG